LIKNKNKVAHIRKDIESSKISLLTLNIEIYTAITQKKVESDHNMVADILLENPYLINLCDR
jgi:hypothetical protein